MNFLKINLVTIMLIILLSSCSLNLESEHEIKSEIYSGLIDYGKSGNLVISSLTESQPFDKKDWQWASNIFPQLEKETWENFLQVNSQQVPFPNNLDLDYEYTLLDVEKNPPDWSQENCVEIHYFSQIGFNSSRTQALVSSTSDYYDVTYGNLYYLERIDGSWKVADMAEGFISARVH